MTTEARRSPPRAAPSAAAWLIALLLAAAALAGAADPAAPRPTVGAIRWDAWSGGEVTAQVERTLGPERYHDRAPWFAEVLAPDRLGIDASPQAVMDREIAFAADAGLDYWAFLIYPRGSAMSAALGQYLASAARGRLGFCAILHSALGVPEAQWPDERARIVALMREPTYQKVLGGRPLAYLFNDGFLRSDRAGRLQELRAEAKRAGLDPYLVYMGWNPRADFAAARPAGCDAVSAYAYPSSDRFDRYEQLARAAEQGYWQAAIGAAIPFVPLVTSGWDKRPRIDHPVSWEKGAGYHAERRWIDPARPDEIAAHLRRGLDVVEAHPQLCQARTLIVYAWNEYDEGGWIAPTLGADGTPDTRRLDALRAVLRP